MAEAYHKWLAEMPPWERFWREVILGQNLSCSTVNPYPSWVNVFAIIIAAAFVVGVILLIWVYFQEDNDTHPPVSDGNQGGDPL